MSTRSCRAGVVATGFAVMLAACAASRTSGIEASARVAAVLDEFHQAASKCDLERYLQHFSSAGVFLGTDASERWTREEFRAFCAPYFARGQGWTYTPTARHIRVAADGASAWFDELLHNEKYGEVRGSGVLVRRAGEWWIEHYVMSFTIPNELAGEWLKVRAGGAEASR